MSYCFMMTVTAMELPRAFLHTNCLSYSSPYPTCYSDFYFEYTVAELPIFILFHLFSLGLCETLKILVLPSKAIGGSPSSCLGA